MNIRRFAVLPFAFFATALFSQHDPSKTTTTFYPAMPSPGFKPSPPSAPAPGIVPLFLEGDGFSSSLVMVNPALNHVSATITLRDLEGRLLVTKQIVLEKGSRSSVDISSLLQRLPNAPMMGSLSIQQDVNVPGKVVLAQLTIVDERNSAPAYIDEEISMAAANGSSTLRGVADSADGPALVAVTNLADSTQQVRIRCLVEKGQSGSLSVAIPAHGTSLSPACSDQKIDRLADYKIQFDKVTPLGATGFEVVGDGAPGMLAAFALAPHQHYEGEVFSAVAFVDPKSLQSANIIYTGVPFGSQTVLTDGTYAPRIALTNFSKQPAQVAIEAFSSRPQEAEDGAETAETITPEVLHVALAAGESREVPVAIASGTGGLQHSVIVKSDRLPGEVQSKLVSRSDSRLFEAELLGKDEKTGDNAGGHPWITQDGVESLLLLFNHSAVTKTFGVGISNGIQVWNKRYRVAPFATRQLNINQIIRDQVKDDDGTTLDPHYPEGAVLWSTSNPGEGKGRLLVSDRAAAMAHNFSCGGVIVLCGATVSIYNNGSLPLGSAVAYGYVTPTSCLSQRQGLCSGTNANPNASVDWSLGNASIANFSPPNAAYNLGPALLGISLGTTSASVTVIQGGCQVNVPGNPVSVGLKLTLVSNDCNSTPSTGQMHAGWGNNGISGCLLSADVPYFNALKTGGTCVTNPDVFQVYEYLNASNQTVYAYPVHSRIADKDCTKFIDGVTDGVITQTVVP